MPRHFIYIHIPVLHDRATGKYGLQFIRKMYCFLYTKIMHHQINMCVACMARPVHLPGRRLGLERVRVADSGETLRRASGVRWPGAVLDSAFVTDSPAESPVLSAAETSVAESLLAAAWGRPVSVRSAKTNWGRQPHHAAARGRY